MIASASEFGVMIRQRRKALGLTQDQLAARCGFGVRFIVDLESGKPSCQLGKALMVAVEVGIDLGDLRAEKQSTNLPPQGNDDDPLSHLPKF